MGVRQEAVRLTLQDDFTTGMARAAAATAVLRKELHGLDGTNVNVGKNLDATSRSIDNTGKSSAAAALGLNRYSGRLGLIRDAVLGLGPAIIPLSASLLPALSAAFAGLGAAAGGIGVTVLAMQGLGDAVESINKYQLQPTTANLEKMQLAMSQLGPSAQEVARYFANLTEPINELQEIAGQNLFPGLLDGLDAVRERGPEAERIISHLAAGMGELAREAGEGIAGPKFTSFFDYLETDARPTLESFGRALGSVAEGLANLVVAFAPLTRSFIGGFEEMTASFAEWSRGLDQNQSFQNFLSYIRESGPAVLDFLGSLIGALSSIVQAAAPFASVLLPSLTAILDVLTAIADSDFGPAIYSGIAGLLVLNRVARLTTGPLARINEAFLDIYTASSKSGGLSKTAVAMERFGGAAKAAAGVAGLGLFVMSMHETNDALASFETVAGAALAGFSVGGPWGAAIGAAAGTVIALGRAHSDASLDVDTLSSSFDQQTGAITENTRVMVANDLQKQGFLDIANDLGVAQGTVTDAVMGNADALIYLNSVLDAAIAKGRGNRVGPLADLALGATHLQEALPGLTGSFADTAEGANHLSAEIGSTVVELDAGAAAAKEFQDALTDLDQFLSKRAAVRSYQEDLKALRKTLEDTPEAFWKIQDAADAVVGDVSNFLQQVQDPKKRMTFLGDALKQLREFADSSPKAAAAIQPLINRLKGLRADAKEELKLKVDTRSADDRITQMRGNVRELHDETQAKPLKFIADANAFFDVFGTVKDDMHAANRLHASPKVDLEEGNTLSILDLIKAKIDGLHDKSITIHTAYTGGEHVTPASTHEATGGYIRGPGTTTSDSIPAWLSDREYVIRAKSVDKYGVAMMHAINAGRFAGGGQAGVGGVGPIGPNSQLYGLGSSWLSAAELSERMLNLTSKQFRSLIADIALLSEKGLAKFGRALEKSEEAMEKQKQKVEEINSAMASLSGSVSSGLKSQLFGDQGSGWATSGGVGGALSTLTSDIGRGQQYTQLVAMLQAQGLHGGALQALLETNDVATLTQFANASPDQLAQYQSLYDQREAVTGSAGSAAAEAIYGDAQQAEIRELREVRNEVRRLRAAVEKADKKNQEGHQQNAQDVAEGINVGFHAGHRRGNRGHR